MITTSYDTNCYVNASVYYHNNLNLCLHHGTNRISFHSELGPFDGSVSSNRLLRSRVRSTTSTESGERTTSAKLECILDVISTNASRKEEQGSLTSSLILPKASFALQSLLYLVEVIPLPKVIVHHLYYFLLILLLVLLLPISRDQH